jgi:cell division protein FtsX
MGRPGNEHYTYAEGFRTGCAEIGRPATGEEKHDDDDGPDFRTLLHAWLESHRASMADSLRRLGKQPIGSFFTCLVMAVALSMPMGLSLLLKNVEKLGGSWQRAAQISLYLKLDAGSREGEALRDEIKGMPGVADAQYVSREQALEEFQQQSGLGEALRELPDNPLPGVVVVTPTEVDKPALEALASAPVGAAAGGSGATRPGMGRAPGGHPQAG